MVCNYAAGLCSNRQANDSLPVTSIPRPIDGRLELWLTAQQEEYLHRRDSTIIAGFKVVFQLQNIELPIITGLREEVKIR